MSNSTKGDYHAMPVAELQKIDDQVRLNFSSHRVGLALMRHFQRLSERAFKKGEMEVVELLKHWAIESFEGSRPIHHCWALHAITMTGFWDGFLQTVEQCLIAAEENRMGVFLLISDQETWTDRDGNRTGKISLGLEPDEKKVCMDILLGSRPWHTQADGNEMLMSIFRVRVEKIKDAIGGGWQS